MCVVLRGRRRRRGSDRTSLGTEAADFRAREGQGGSLELVRWIREDETFFVTRLGGRAGTERDVLR